MKPIRLIGIVLIVLAERLNFAILETGDNHPFRIILIT